ITVLVVAFQEILPRRNRRVGLTLRPGGKIQHALAYDRRRADIGAYAVDEPPFPARLQIVPLELPRSRQPDFVHAAIPPMNRRANAPDGIRPGRLPDFLSRLQIEREHGRFAELIPIEDDRPADNHGRIAGTILTGAQHHGQAMPPEFPALEIVTDDAE